MADKTAIFESAQALFCAIADYVGDANVKGVFKYPTYKQFKTNDERKGGPGYIKTAFAKTDTVGVDLEDIEKLLLKENNWYKSSVLIAVKLITDIADIDSDFKKIKKPGWQDFFYVRGASAGTTAMDDIGKLFSKANKNEKKFGDINKWSPADIYFVSSKATKYIQSALDNSKDGFNFTQLNTLCNGLVNDGELLPLSLKKIKGKSVNIVKYNFKESDTETSLSKYSYKGSKKSDSGRDLQLIFTEDGKSQLKIRHDPSHKKFGINKAIKIEIIVKGMGGRLGSASGIPQIISIINDSGVPSSALIRGLNGVQSTGFNKYETKIKELNVKYDARGIGNPSGTNTVAKMAEIEHSDGTIPSDKKNRYTEYKDERALLSKTILMDKILPLIKTWFEKNNKAPDDLFIDDSAKLIQQFIKYASSRSPDSGKFVIAK